MTRRDFLRGLLGASTVTAAGLLVPSRTTYVFLRENPLAVDPIDIPVSAYTGPKGAWQRAVEYEYEQLRAAFVGAANHIVDDIRFNGVPYVVDPELPRGTRMFW